MNKICILIRSIAFGAFAALLAAAMPLTGWAKDTSSALAAAREKHEARNIRLLFSPSITDGSIEYKVEDGDNLESIAGSFGTTVDLIKASNGLKDDLIIAGSTLKVVTAKFSILINKSQNRLFLNKDGKIFKTYVVSTGRNNSTPAGKFTIEEKMVSPLWYKVGAVVPPDSPEYALGTRWMGLSVKGYGIHGTKEPGLIGRQVTHGCVRMLNSDAEELYVIVPGGTEVVIED